MRILFLLDSPKNFETANFVLPLIPALQKVSHEVAAIFFRPNKAISKHFNSLGIPTRALQFFDSRINFYAPGLRSCISLFQPDAIVFCGAGTLFHGGPLSRFFKGIPQISLTKFSKNPNWFSRHSLRRSQIAFFADEFSRERLLEILPRERVVPFCIQNFTSIFAVPEK